MAKIILDATVRVELEINSVIGETTEEISAKLKSGDYCISLFGDTVYRTEQAGEDHGIVATIGDKEIIESDYTFEKD